MTPEQRAAELVRAIEVSGGDRVILISFGTGVYTLPKQPAAQAECWLRELRAPIEAAIRDAERAQRERIATQLEARATLHTQLGDATGVEALVLREAAAGLRRGE